MSIKSLGCGSQVYKSAPAENSHQAPSMITLAETIKEIRTAIQSPVRQRDGVLQAKPLDSGFYQQCIDNAVRRGYPVDGYQCVRTHLDKGVVYATACLAHVNRKLQIRVALVTSCMFFVDDLARDAPEVANVYHFNNRFIHGQPQGNGVLDALADLLHETPVYFEPVLCNIITTSFLNSITGNLLEYETKGMKISGDAQQYPAYSRNMSGATEAYAVYVFPCEIPLSEYIQAIPEVASFIIDMNDVLSFYKEEKVGEATNQISLVAARGNTSKLDVLDATFTREF